MDESKNLIIAVVISVVVLFAWRAFVEDDNINHKKHVETSIKKDKDPVVSQEDKTDYTLLDRKNAVKKYSRSHFSNNLIKGSINYKGARLDDLQLLNYKASMDDDSDFVNLLSPQNSYDSYFFEAGWISSDENIELPTPNTIWHLESSDEISNIYTLKWINPQNISFTIKYSLDEKYLFSIEQSISNFSDSQVEITPYYRFNRIKNTHESTLIVNEGISATLNKKFIEMSYDDIRKKKKHTIHNTSDNHGWFGFSDKYWFTALIPNTNEISTIETSYNNINNQAVFQIASRETTKLLNQGDTVTNIKYLFTGPKEIDVIDHYQNEFKIDTFDRAIDFGIFYIFTKPILIFLKFVYDVIGNFGIAIMILTILIKSLMIPVSNKSFISMTKMRLLQPKIAKIKEKYQDDKIALQKESLALFKKYDVKPMAGCLPIFLQIPVFFALYKVLYISIDMRHASFFGWIKDLSAPDPSNIFTLFGLIQWDTPDFLNIGILPLILGGTLIIQQRVGNTLASTQDPMQANVMKMMPYFFIFVFAGFPSGLIIYWILGNLFSILQQYIIKKKTTPYFQKKYDLKI